MTATKRGRGRPRPQETINRDQQALRLLRRGTYTRDELAARLHCTSHLAYLTLWRLHRTSQVRRVPNGKGGSSNLWEARESRESSPQ